MTRFLQVAVRDSHYPRNQKIRDSLRALGHEVLVQEFDPGAKTRFSRFREVYLWVKSNVVRNDVVVLTELSLQYFLPVWAATRAERPVYIWTDFFVGLHETNVQDWGRVSRWSVPALAYAAMDTMALKLSDAVTTDTEIRADSLSLRAKSVVVSVPVGAPNWAAPSFNPKQPPAAGLDVLFYAHLSPLHGLSTLVEGLAEAHRRGNIRTISFVVTGELTPRLPARIAEAGLSLVTTIKGEVDSTELHHAIEDCHVVLGVFGQSTKARTVFPNKVWQALLSARPVVTISSAAYEPWRHIVPSLLLEVPDGDACGQSIAAALTELAGRYPNYVDAAREAIDLRSAFETTHARRLALLLDQLAT